MISIRKKIVFDNQEISYLHKDGKQPAILFLHGWGGSAESWQPLWEAMDTDQEMIAIDFPGFGSSPPPLCEWDVAAYTSCVVKYLDAINITPVHLVSHSFGGRIATKLLAEQSDLFRNVVYIAAAGIKNQNEKIQTISMASSVIKKIFSVPVLRLLFPLVRRVGYRFIGGQDYLATSGTMKQTFQNVVAEDLKPLISNINNPTKIFWGLNDSYVPIADGKYMQSVIPNSTLTIFKDGRHGIHKTHAHQIAQEISNYLV